jgi:secreted trypsin-like serine protease
VQFRKTVPIAATLATAAAIGLGAAVSNADVEPTIIGGHEATGNTDWMVSVQYDAPAHNRFDWHTCGGTLAVARDIVITNAHCVTDPPTGVAADMAARMHLDEKSVTIPTKDKIFKVRVGSKDWTTGGEVVPVKSITVHPAWNWAIGAPDAEVSDLAVLRLEHPVDYQQMQLASTRGRPGDKVVLYGWGIDHPDSATEPLPRRLQQIESSVITKARCTDVAISAKEICVDNPNGTDGICFGDSGGPAVRYTTGGVPQLVGGVSRGSGDYCGVNPNAFTSQPEFRTWIYEVVRSSAPPIGETASVADATSAERP